MFEWYFDLSGWLRAGIGLLLLAAATGMVLLGLPFVLWVFALGVLALAGAVPNPKSEWGDW